MDIPQKGFCLVNKELSLLRRVTALEDERTKWSQKLKAGKLTLEEISETEDEIAAINRQLRELYGY